MAIVARGYRKRRRGVVVVGETGVPLVSAADGGDEAALLARRFAGPVITAERRVEAAALACARFAADTIVLDDGFQHRALARDADLVLLDDPAMRACCPRTLRESRAALDRARARCWWSTGPRRRPRGPAAFRARLVPTALVSAAAEPWALEPLAALGDPRSFAVAGVARPERFAATLAAAGARVVRLLRFPDHHAYTADDVAAIAPAGEGTLVTTEKDLVKLAAGRSCPAARARFTWR